MRLRLHLARRPRRLALTSAVGAVALLAATPASAQNNDDDDDGNNNNNNAAPAPTRTGTGDEPTETEAQDEATETEAQDEPTETEAQDEPTETEAQDEPTETEAQDEPTETETEDEPTETETEDEPTETETEAEPTVTDEPTETTEAPGLTGLPSLTKGYGIPTYPAASVPPTENAPFMHHSTAPEGTVFIAVGSILGAMALGILIWRLIVGLLLHRSVKRAAMAQHGTDVKSGFPAPPAEFYKYTDQGSTMSLGGNGAVNGRGVRRTNRGPVPSSTPSQANLFFSPTAATSATPGNRASGFLPSGFYAAGASNPSHGHSISLTNLRPDSRGQGAGRGNIGPSPPDSPNFPPVRRDSPSSFSARHQMSASTLSLSAPNPNGQRAPSAYLEDLLADDPASLPPPQMPPSTGPRNSTNIGPGPNRI